MEKKHWEAFFNVARDSLSVQTYADLSEWIRTNLTKFLPHEIMIYYWGDFNSSASNYEVAIFKERQQMISAKTPRALNGMPKLLYDKWIANNSRWYTINQTDDLFLKMNFSEDTEIQSIEYKSILVYGVHEMFGDSTCLYVFLSKEPAIQVDYYVMGMVMPYLDGAIKRIKGLRAVPIAQDYINLSKRELEIMEWVNIGKTNYEIGKILSISHNTVKNHLKVIFKKLNVISRAQAVSKYSITSRIQ